jgi:hypothetical protein
MKTVIKMEPIENDIKNIIAKQKELETLTESFTTKIQGKNGILLTIEEERNINKLQGTKMTYELLKQLINTSPANITIKRLHEACHSSYHYHSKKDITTEEVIDFINRTIIPKILSDDDLNNTKLISIMIKKLENDIETFLEDRKNSLGKPPYYSGELPLWLIGKNRINKLILAALLKLQDQNKLATVA